MTPPCSPELHVRGVSWAVSGHPILTAVDAAVPAGGLVGLLGPNGSGKSSLLAIVAGLVRPDRGRVLLGGTDVHALGVRARARRIALVRQQADTDLDLRVAEIVALGRTPHRALWATTTDPDDEPAITDALRRTDLATLGHRAWSTLSGGERQRTQLARALAQQPELLVLDEPTNHLDLAHQIELLRLVRDLPVTTLTALHDLELAAAFCDHLVLLDHGRVAAAGLPRDVLTADLIAQVYGVTAQILDHPTTGRPHILWNP